MRKEGAGLLIIIALTCFMPFVSASFQVGNLSNDLKSSYSPSEKISGWVNISFQNELAANLLSGSAVFSGSIDLKSFLDKNGANYTCIPKDCNKEYDISNAETSKSFSLPYGGEKTLALVLNGNIDEVTNLSFDISVSNDPSCIRPLKIDILDDDLIDWSFGNLTTNYQCTYQGKGEAGRGCYSSPGAEEVKIGLNKYCERIGLTENKKFEIGAWLRGNDSTTWATGLLVMRLYDLDGNELASCNLTKPPVSGEEKSCAVEHDNKMLKDFYVCVDVKEDTEYRIRRENTEPCGFYGAITDTYNYDYSIFARAAVFSGSEKINFNQQIYDSDNANILASDVSDYISSRYNKNCTNNCTVPVKFSAGIDVSVTVSNIKLDYKEGGSSVTDNKIYSTATISPKISSDFTKLELSHANITAPKTYGNYTFILYLDNEGILNRKINVEKVPVINSITPLILPASKPTKFIADVYSPLNRSIISYNWDFGDGTTETTTENTIMHTYDSIENFTLTLGVVDDGNYAASRQFNVMVVSPKDAVNSTINIYKIRIDRITSQLASMPWYNSLIETSLGVDDLKSGVISLERKFLSATGDSEYMKIMESLSAIEVPYSINKTGYGEIPFFLNANNINPSYLYDMGAGSYKEEDKESYREGIAAWSRDNLNMKITYEYVSAYYDDKIKELLGDFNLEVKTGKQADKDFYVIINSKDIKFSSIDYKTREFEDATGITFDNIADRNIEFAVFGGMPIDNLIAYVSPEFSQIQTEKVAPCNFNGDCESGENWKNCRSDCKPVGWFIFWIFIIILGAAGAYILLQLWYKNKYESYLFKNKSELYNIINFIRNAKSRGMAEKDIRNNLKKAGWANEQIWYAIRKSEGKSVMLFDFLKLFARLKKEKPKGALLSLSIKR